MRLRQSCRIAVWIGIACCQAAHGANPTSRASRPAEKSKAPAATTPRGPVAPPAKTPTPHTTMPAKLPANVNAAFAIAQKLYMEGQYPAAIAAFDAILRRYPGHEPTITYYARTLYKLDRIPESYNLFARINPQFLDPETSYEYGQAFMTAKQYEGALYAFKRIPKGHALADLANYYGAVCALKLRRYKEAEDMLDSAVVLPERLSRTRTLYLKHLEELRLLQEKKALAQDRDQERRRLAEKPGADRKMATGPVPTPTPAGYVHNGFFLTKKAAQVGYTYTRQELDYSGYANDSIKSNLAYFNFYAGQPIPLGFKVGKNEAALGIQVQLGAEDLHTTGQINRIVVQDDSPDILRIQSEPDGTIAHTKAGIAASKLWLEVPAPNNFWIGTGGELIFRYGDFERSGRKGTREGLGQVGYKSPLYDVFAKGSYFDTVDVETKPTSTRVHGELTGRFHPQPYVPNLHGRITGQYEQFTYPLDLIDGPDSSAALIAVVEQGLPLGFELGAFASAEQQTGYVAHAIAGYDTLVANGQLLTGKIFLENKLGNIFAAKISQLWQKTTWTVRTDGGQEAFARNVPDYNATFVGDVSINLWF